MYKYKWFHLLLVLAMLVPTLPAVPAFASYSMYGELHRVSLSVDGVELTLDTPLLPNEFLEPDPDSALQVASAVRWHPYQEISITAIPYGSYGGTESHLIAQPGAGKRLLADLINYRQEHGQVWLSGPSITLFGKQVTGTVSTMLNPPWIDSPCLLITEWVVEAGQRIWVIRVSQEQDAQALSRRPLNIVAPLSQISLSSPNVNRPSTSIAAWRKEPSSFNTDTFTPQNVSENLPSPSWWNGDCDKKHYHARTGRWAYPLGSSYRGVKTCGPRPHFDHAPDVLVYFFSGAHGELEWECAELSMRYLYLAYHVPPYPGNGKDIVWNYHGSRLEKIRNGTHGKAPVPGDVISYGPTSKYGHTAIVVSSYVDSHGNGSVTVIDQNDSLNGVRKPKPIRNWFVQDGLVVSGWLHERATDHKPPHTGVTLNDLSSSEWPNWFTGPVAVHLHATDQGGSGVKEIHYRLDGGSWQTRSGHDTSFDISTDGNHTLEFYAVDKANPANRENTRSVAFHIDTTPPTAPGDISEGHGLASGVWQSDLNDPDFTWGAATDAASGIDYYRIEWNNASNFALTPAYDPPPVHTGRYTLTVRAVDRAGNVGPATTFRFNYDGTPPHAPDIQNSDGVASGVWQNRVRVPHFSWPTPSDPGSGVVGYYLYWGSDANGTDSTLTTTQSFALNTPICDPDDAASYYLRVRSQDRVGLKSDWVAFVLNYDGAPPVASLTANYGQEVVHQTLVHLDISASDLGSGVSGIRLSNEGHSWSDWLEPVDELTWEIPSVGHREYDIYLQARDSAGNVSAIVSDTVYLDVNVPRPHSESYDLWDSAVVGGGNTSTTTLHTLTTSIQWHNAPASVGQQYQMVGGFPAGAQAAPTEVPTATQQYVQIGSLVSAGGTGATPMQSSNYQLHGSLGQPSDMKVITGTQYVASLGYWGGVATDVETQGPPPPPPPPPPECEFYSISINDGALFTNKPEVTLNLCGPDADKMMLSNDGGFSDAAWQSYTRTISWTLTTYGNYVLPRNVYARFQGSDGSIHGNFFDDIIYDPHAPSNAVAFDPTNLLPGTRRPTGVDALQVVSTDQVDLFVSATDDNSGLAEIQVSQRSDFADAEWQPFSSVLPVTLPEEGVQRVYVRTRDQAHNESTPTSASIIVDRTPPTATIRMRDEIVGPDTVSVTLLVTATDAFGKVTAMQIDTNPAMTDTIWITYTPEITLYQDFTGVLTPTVYVRLRDEAGNESPVYSTTYTVDVTPPWGTVEVESRGETTATLRFAVKDDLSGVKELLFSSDPWFFENVTRQPYQDRLVWDFRDTNEVYVGFADGVGNWSEGYWVPRRETAAMTITKSVVPTGPVSYGDELTYTLVVSTAPGTEVGIYDPLTDLTFERFTQPVTGVIYSDSIITGSLTVTPTTPVTITFVARAGLSNTVVLPADVSNSACIYPAWSTLYNCLWSNTVTNEASHTGNNKIYLPLVLRND